MPERDRAHGLDHERHGRAQTDKRPDLRRAHAVRSLRTAPAKAASPAANTGSPGGTTGTSASAIAAPSAATQRARRLRSSTSSSARKKVGEIASSPYFLGSPSTSPAKAPTTVPVTHVTYCTAVDPNRNQRSNVPSPRLAIAQEASATVCPCAARLCARPGSDGASAIPIARKREFISAAAPTAAPMLPPAETIEIAANWAEPANTIADITIAAITLKPASRASTPNDSERRNPASAYGTPARRPARHDALRVAPSSIRRGTPAAASTAPLPAPAGTHGRHASRATRPPRRAAPARRAAAARGPSRRAPRAPSGSPRSPS